MARHHAARRRQVGTVEYSSTGCSEYSPVRLCVCACVCSGVCESVCVRGRAHTPTRAARSRSRRFWASRPSAVSARSSHCRSRSSAASGEYSEYPPSIEYPLMARGDERSTRQVTREYHLVPLCSTPLREYPREYPQRLPQSVPQSTPESTLGEYFQSPP